MQETNNLKNLIIALVILLAIGFACYMYLTRDKDALSADLLIGIPAGGAAMDGDLISALGSLRRLQLDTSFLSDQTSILYPAWQSLWDFGKELIPQPAGRPNPFEPFPGEIVQKGN